MHSLFIQGYTSDNSYATVFMAVYRLVTSIYSLSKKQSRPFCAPHDPQGLSPVQIDQ